LVKKIAWNDGLRRPLRGTGGGEKSEPGETDFKNAPQLLASSPVEASYPEAKMALSTGKTTIFAIPLM
jgi:hypothetical protein